MQRNGLTFPLALTAVLTFGLEARGAFLRSDFNADGKVDIADPVSILGYLFQGSGAAACLDSGDVNDDGSLDISDAVYSLAFLFLGGGAPALPYPACGDDPTDDALDCATGQSCGTISCGDPTPGVTEGPYYKAGSPERSSLLEADTIGQRLILTGSVLSADCVPIPMAWLDFWHADASGNYDNAGYKLRGHQFTDASGRYSLETIVPGLYPGRTEHIHVKVKAPNGPILTSQLFFPGVSQNEGDNIFREELLISVDGNGDPLKATFDFVVADGS